MLRALEIQYIVLFVIVFMLDFSGELVCFGENKIPSNCSSCPEFVHNSDAPNEHCTKYDFICGTFSTVGRIEDTKCIPCECHEDEEYFTCQSNDSDFGLCAMIKLKNCINKPCKKNHCPSGQVCVFTAPDLNSTTIPRRTCIPKGCVNGNTYDPSICKIPKDCMNGDIYDSSLCRNQFCSTNTCPTGQVCIYDDGDPPKQNCIPKECMNGSTYDPSLCRNQFCFINTCSAGKVCIYDDGDPPKEKCIPEDCMARGYFVASDCNDVNVTLNNPNVGINRSLCGAYNLMTGKIARAGVGVALIATGGMFFFGKIGLVTLLSIGTGSGIIFGTPSIMKVVIGKKLEC